MMETCVGLLFLTVVLVIWFLSELTGLGMLWTFALTIFGVAITILVSYLIKTSRMRNAQSKPANWHT